MPWFKVDDSLHAHAKVLAAGNAALGLWVRCGAYAAQHLTDGFIPRAVALMYGNRSLAHKLVAAGLWSPVEGGWQMHDFGDYNPSSESVRAEREAASERQRRARDAAKSQRESRRDKSVINGVSHSVSHGPPDPTRPGSSGALGGVCPETYADHGPRQEKPDQTEPPEPPVTSTNGTPPEPEQARCDRHRGVAEPPPCRACGQAREHAEHAQHEHTKRVDAQRREAIRACSWCEADGWRIDPHHPHRGPLVPGIRCDHTPLSRHQLEELAS